MANQTPETIITYEIYKDGYRLIGTAEVELPSLQATTVEVKGAGIAGQVDSPVLGHFQGQTMKMTFRTTTADTASILEHKAHHIEAWGAVQVMDVASGTYSPKQLKIVTRAIPKSYTLGKFAVGELQGAEIEFEVIYCKTIFDGNTVYEIDKYNGLYVAGGNNITNAIWRTIGLM